MKDERKFIQAGSLENPGIKNEELIQSSEPTREATRESAAAWRRPRGVMAKWNRI